MRTIEDIKNLIDLRNLEALKAYVDEYIENKVKQNFEKEVKKEYEEKYSAIKTEEVKNLLGEVIDTSTIQLPVLEYDNVTTLEDGIEVKHYTVDKITLGEGEDAKELDVLVDNPDNPGNKILNPELQKLIENGDVVERPTYDFYKQLKLNENPNALTPTDADYADEALANLILNDAIPTAADIALDKAKRYLAGKQNVTPDQLERYRIKYDLAKAAKAGDANAKAKLSLEAELLGQDPTAYINLIIKVGTAWNNAINDFTIKIEAVRVRTQKLVQVKIKKVVDVDGNVKIITPQKELETMGKNLRKAVDVIQRGSQLSANVTDEEIKNLFK